MSNLAHSILNCYKYCRSRLELLLFSVSSLFMKFVVLCVCILASSVLNTYFFIHSQRNYQNRWSQTLTISAVGVSRLFFDRRAQSTGWFVSGLFRALQMVILDITHRWTAEISPELFPPSIPSSSADPKEDGPLSSAPDALTGLVGLPSQGPPELLFD